MFFKSILKKPFFKRKEGLKKTILNLSEAFELVLCSGRQDAKVFHSCSKKHYQNLLKYSAKLHWSFCYNHYFVLILLKKSILSNKNLTLLCIG